MPQCKGTHGKQRNAKENEPKRNGKWQKVWRKLIANKGKTKNKKIAWCTILELPCEHRLIYMDDE